LQLIHLLHQPPEPLLQLAIPSAALADDPLEALRPDRPTAPSASAVPGVSAVPGASVPGASAPGAPAPGAFAAAATAATAVIALASSGLHLRTPLAQPPAGSTVSIARLSRRATPI